MWIKKPQQGHFMRYEECKGTRFLRELLHSHRESDVV